jgi:hypothetical protein
MGSLEEESDHSLRPPESTPDAPPEKDVTPSCTELNDRKPNEDLPAPTDDLPLDADTHPQDERTTDPAAQDSPEEEVLEDRQTQNAPEEELFYDQQGQTIPEDEGSRDLEKEDAPEQEVPVDQPIQNVPENENQNIPDVIQDLFAGGLDASQIAPEEENDPNSETIGAHGLDAEEFMEEDSGEKAPAESNEGTMESQSVASTENESLDHSGFLSDPDAEGPDVE